MSFFGRYMFFGVGGLLVAPLWSIELATGDVAPWGVALMVGWFILCVVWVLLGMIARTRP